MNLCIPSICIEKVAKQAQAEARATFWAFRRYMRPDMAWGWWLELIAVELQQFYQDFVDGQAPPSWRFWRPRNAEKVGTAKDRFHSVDIRQKFLNPENDLRIVLG